MTPTYDDHRRALRAVTGPLATTADDTLDADVAACPGWDVRTLLHHLAAVCEWAAALVRARGDRVPWDEGDRASGDPRPRLAGAVTAVDDLLGSIDPTTPAGSWAGRQDAAWWARRLAYESAVHAWDVTSAARGGRTAEGSLLSPELAVDGVDEVLDVFAPRRFDAAGFGGHDETLHLHATDADGEWLVTCRAGGLEVDRTHAKGDVAVRGPAWALLLATYGRIEPGDGDLVCFGDHELFRRWRTSLRL